MKGISLAFEKYDPSVVTYSINNNDSIIRALTMFSMLVVLKINHFDVYGLIGSMINLFNSTL